MNAEPRASRSHEWINTFLAALALIGTLLVGIMQVYSESFGAQGQVASQLLSTCEAWTEFVVDQQSSEDYNDLPDRTVDQRIDRMAQAMVTDDLQQLGAELLRSCGSAGTIR